MEKLVSRNPANGGVLGELEQTRPDELGAVFTRAAAAQKAWGALPPKKRARFLHQLREVLLNRLDEVTDLIARENGKPRFEALSNELIPSLDLLAYFAKSSPQLLANRKIHLSVMKHRKSYLHYWPLGVVAVISPWNYPFLLPFGEILMALVAGNAVVFKPSEATPLIGLKIQELCEQAGLPHDVLQTVVGDGSVGAAMIQQKPAKVFFTGSVATGKKIMAAAAEHLIPVTLELGGKDAMIVLADADLDYATSAAMWGGYSNSGQVCASVERVLVQESIAPKFIELLKEKLGKLRQGASIGLENDLGPITFEKQKSLYDEHLSQARAANAEISAGGDFSADRRYLAPTIVTGPAIETLKIYNDETFGPVLAVTTFRSVAEAIEKANRSRYGLLASVITRDISLGEQVARQLEVGTVTINEVTYTAALGETPWGGVKESGFGRKHSDIGLYEFVNIRHIHKPRSRLLVFKSPWWFPYTPHQFEMFRKFAELYRRHWFDRVRAFPHFLWNAVQFLKREKRL